MKETIRKKTKMEQSTRKVMTIIFSELSSDSSEDFKERNTVLN